MKKLITALAGALVAVALFATAAQASAERERVERQHEIEDRRALPRGVDIDWQ